MSWHRADNAILSANSLALVGALPGNLGAAALGYLSTLRAWCSEERTVEIPEPVLLGLGRLLRIGMSGLRQIVSALAVCGYLEQGTDGGARLLDEAVVRPSAPALPETGKAARQRRYKEKAKRLQASPEASPGDGAGVSQGDGGASPEASPLALPSPPIPPSPARTQAHALAREERAPAALDLPLSGEDAPQSNTTAPSRPSPPPAGATAPTGAPEAQEAPVTAKPKKARPARSLPPRKALGEAYAAGISQVTGSPCSPPSERWELEALEAALGTHAPGVVGAEALGWVTSAAKDFAQAKAEDRWTIDRGFPPKMAKAWLDGGNRPPPRPISQKPKGGPMVRKGPGPDRNWLLDDEPIDRNATLEDLTRNLFAMPADILQESAQ